MKITTRKKNHVMVQHTIASIASHKFDTWTWFGDGLLSVMSNVRRYLLGGIIVAILFAILLGGSTVMSMTTQSSPPTCTSPPYSCTSVIVLKISNSPGSPVMPYPSLSAGVISLRATYTSNGIPVSGLVIQHFGLNGQNLSCGPLVTNAQGVVTCSFTAAAGKTYCWYTIVNLGPDGVFPVQTNSYCFHT